MFNALIFLSAAAIAWLLVHVIRRLALRLGLLDVPNRRSLHRQPTPRGGGAAIVVVAIAGIAIAAVVGLRPAWSVLAGYVGGALLIAGVSWVDDMRTVRSGFRLVVHVAAAALMIAGLAIQTDLQPIFGHAGPGWVVAAIGLLWTVGLTNAYNFMDGIDGLAATQGIFAALGLTLLGYWSDQPWIALLALLVAAGCTGFLVHNWPPARAFMGDVGSAFLGFTFAFITLAGSRRAPNFTFVGALLLWPFVFDATFTILRRVGRGENILVAHRSHLYQRLVLAGWRQAAVTSLYGLLALVTLALGGIWWILASATTVYAVAAAVLLLSIALWAVVVRSERRQSTPADPRALMGR